MRLFIAIEIPDDLKKMIGRLHVDIPGARWVPAEQIHLTLAFLGEVEEIAVEQLGRELAQIHQPEFRLSFSGTGCFPDRRRPRVLWIGVEPNPHLQALAAMVHEVLLACGIPQESRPFSPHITLARLKIPASGASAAFFDRPEALKLPPFSVREFILFQSRLTPHGAVHSPIRGFPLSAGRVGRAH
jgi:2'-5' RNA ligase